MRPSLLTVGLAAVLAALAAFGLHACGENSDPAEDGRGAGARPPQSETSPAKTTGPRQRASPVAPVDSVSPEAARGTQPTGAPDETDAAPLRENRTTGFVGGAAGWLQDRRARRDGDASPDARARAEAADRAVAWLAGRAVPTGGWGPLRAGEAGADAVRATDVAWTALAVRAILSTGETHQKGARKEEVKEALKFLRNAQSEDGSFDRVSLRRHLDAALALVETYGATMSIINKDAAQRGVNRIHAAQREDGSWADEAGAAAGDAETTAAAAIVLAVAERCELEVERATLAKALAWLGSAPESPRTVLARVLATAVTAPESLRQDATLRVACENLLAGLRRDDVEGLHLAALAAYQIGGATWTRAESALRALDEPSQRRDGDAAGSWDPPDGGADEGARFRETALRCLALGAEWEYPRIVEMR